MDYQLDFTKRGGEEVISLNQTIQYVRRLSIIAGSLSTNSDIWVSELGPFSFSDRSAYEMGLHDHLYVEGCEHLSEARNFCDVLASYFAVLLADSLVRRKPSVHIDSSNCSVHIALNDPVDYFSAMVRYSNIESVEEAWDQARVDSDKVLKVVRTTIYPGACDWAARYRRSHGRIKRIWKGEEYWLEQACKCLL